MAEEKQEAVRWFKLAADQGDADGQFRLGVCYENGTGVAKDKQEAVQWYTRAADQGYADAHCHLWTMLR